MNRLNISSKAASASILLVALLTFSSASMAKIFLQLDGIEGGSTTAGFERLIEIDSYQEGIAASISVSSDGKRAPSKPFGSEISMSKVLDATSPQLRLALVKGEKIKNAKIIVASVFRDTPTRIFELELTDVFITSVSGSAGGSDAFESFSLSYATIKWTHFAEDGKQTTAGYDFENSKVLE